MRISLDPTGHYTDGLADSKREAMERRLVMALGIVPQFVLEAVEKLEAPLTVESFYKALCSEYQYYLGPMEGGTVDASGVYQYPEDPDLYPLVSWEVGEGVTTYMYQYAIVAVTDGTTTLITRMD